MIKVKLKTRQGIKIDLSNKYLFDPSLIQEYVDLTKDYSDKAIQSEANAKQSETNAKASETRATQEANASAESAYQSQQSALASAEYASNAEADAQNANESLDNVLVVLDNVLASEQRTKASETNAKASENAALSSADMAVAKAQESSNSAKTSKEKADEASQSVLECQAIKDSLGTVYVFKGSVNTESELPNNAQVGDVYDVKDTGINYAWTGTEWDALGVTVDFDLSEYAKKSDLNTKQDKLTAGTGIKIENNVVSNTQTSAEWGNITGTLSNQTDLQNALNGKANLNLSNSTAITNCITEIPQDIKLELEDGTLTLKAGSKLTWGGTEYRTTTTTADQTYSYSGSYEGKALIFSARSSGVIQTPSVLSRISSGKSEDRPATATAGSVYYSTDDMKFNYYGSSGWSEWAVAYPLALVTIAGGIITSIDQVFNGFGYIGSTVFALPGVKGLIPNGRNDDGTLRNRIVITKGVSILTADGQGVRYTTLANNGKLFNNNSYLYYNEKRNIYTRSDGLGLNGYMPVIRYVISDGVITEFKPKLPFRAVDYNDMPTITYWE